MSSDWRTAYLARVRALHSVSPTQGFYNAWRANRKPGGIECTKLILSQAQKARLGYGRDETVYQDAITLSAIHAKDVFELNGQCFDINELRKWWFEKNKETNPLTNEVVPDDVRNSVIVERRMFIHYHKRVRLENTVRFRPIRERFVITNGRVDDYSAWDIDGNAVRMHAFSQPPNDHTVATFVDYPISGHQKYYYEYDRRSYEYDNFIAWKDTDTGEIVEYIVASGSDDHTIRLWNTSTEEQIDRLNGHTGAVTSVAFSPKGDVIASGSRDRSVRLWTVDGGVQVKRMTGHEKDVRSVAFSPDGKYIASGSEDSTVRLWSVETGAQVKLMKGHADTVRSVAFSPNGSYIASGSYDKTVRLWKAGDGTYGKLLGRHDAWVMSVAFSPNGKYIASGSWDRSVQLWNIANYTRVKKISYYYTVYSVAFSHDSAYIASGLDFAEVKLWIVDTGGEKYFQGGGGSVECVAFSPDDKYIVGGLSGNDLQLWAIDVGCVARLTGHTGSVNSVAFAPLVDGQVAARKRQRVDAQRT